MVPMVSMGCREWGLQDTPRGNGRDMGVVHGLIVVHQLMHGSS